MNSEILLKSKGSNLIRFRLSCFLLPGLLLGGGLFYSLYMFAGNVNSCRQYTEPGYCLLTYENSYLEFLKLALGQGKFTKLLPVLFYLGLLLLLWGILLSMARRPGRLTVTDRGIRGITAWGNAVSLPLSAVQEARCGSRQTLILRTEAGEIPFYHIEKREELCGQIHRLLDADRAVQEKGDITLSGKTGSRKALALRCFLPSAVLLLVFLCLGAGDFGWYRELFLQNPEGREVKILIMKLLGGLSYLSISLVFPALLAGVYFWLSDRASALKIAEGRILGTMRFGRPVEIPLTQCRTLIRGHRGKLILWHTGGKAVFPGIKNREEICRAMEARWGLEEEEAPET